MKLFHLKHSVVVSVPRLSQNFRVCQDKLASFKVTLKTVSKKNEKSELLLINALLYKKFTERMRPISEGPKFALFVLTRTAS